MDEVKENVKRLRMEVGLVGINQPKWHLPKEEAQFLVEEEPEILEIGSS